MMVNRAERKGLINEMRFIQEVKSNDFLFGLAIEVESPQPALGRGLETDSATACFEAETP